MFQAIPDYSLFSLRRDEFRLHVLVYVNDLIILGNDHVAVQQFKAYVGQCLHMNDLGNLKSFWGVEIVGGPAEIFLCQRKYALDMISETRLLGAKQANILMEQIKIIFSHLQIVHYLIIFLNSCNNLKLNIGMQP